MFSTARHAVIDFYRSAARSRVETVGTALDEEQTAVEARDQVERQALQELAQRFAPMLEQPSEPDREALQLTKN